jgi:hypothetical protein
MKEEFTFFLCFKQARKLILGIEVDLYSGTFSFNSAKTLSHPSIDHKQATSRG